MGAGRRAHGHQALRVRWALHRPHERLLPGLPLRPHGPRTGEDACPFTSLYWDFLARHRPQLAGNHRLRQQYRGLERLSDLPATRQRADEVRRRLADGTL